MPEISELPPEIWFEIFSLAFRDGGATGAALSQVSRKLRDISRFHRYQSVAITSWTQLTSFESHFSLLPSECRQIVNLYVHLPDMYQDVYTEAWYPEDSDTDSFKSNEMDIEEAANEGPGKEEGGLVPVQHFFDEDEDADADMVSNGSEDSDYFEYEEYAEEEQAELDAELADVLEPTPMINVPDTRLSQLDSLSEINTLLAKHEYYVFSALRRILEGTASTLQILTICLTPNYTFLIDALFPVLPRLRTLSVLKGKSKMRYQLQATRSSPCPPLFSALQNLSILGDFSKAVETQDLMTAAPRLVQLNLSKKNMSVGQIQSLPKTVESVNVYPAAGWMTQSSFPRFSWNDIRRDLLGSLPSGRKNFSIDLVMGKHLENPTDLESEWIRQINFDDSY